jgi:hypothetical protein
MTMKSSLLQFFVTLVAVALALIAYEYYRTPQVDQTRAQTEALRQQAEALSRQASELKDEVSREHDAAARERERHVAASLLSEGLLVASMAKVAIAEFYQSTGAWPSSNHDVGLNDPAQFRGRSLKRMHVSEGGVITLTYDEKTGVNDGTIRLVPDAGNPQMGVRWRCVSPSFREIAISIPPCEYQG